MVYLNTSFDNVMTNMLSGSRMMYIMGTSWQTYLWYEYKYFIASRTENTNTSLLWVQYKDIFICSKADDNSHNLGAHMYWTGPSLVQTMAWHLFNTKPLSQELVIYQ